MKVFKKKTMDDGLDSGIGKRKYSVDETIKLINVWFKVGIGVLFLLFILVKLVFADLSFEFKELDLNAVLSVVLAIFSICLSVAFYFKSSDSANLFYDNTYKFTKDISQILSRIESGFGERLSHIDEGYNSIKDKMLSKMDIDSKKDELEAKEKEVNATIEDKNKIIEELVEKAKLNEVDKEKYLSQLKEKDSMIQELDRKLFILQRQIDKAERINNSTTETERFIANKIVPRLKMTGLRSDMSNQTFARYANKIIEDFPGDLIREMIAYGLIDTDMGLTSRGIKLIKEFM